MRPTYIILAIPVFFTLIGIEVAFARARRRSVYRLSDAVCDLGCGVSQQVLLVLLAGAAMALYVRAYEHHRLVTWRSAAVPWLLAFVGVDFFFYWWHRFSHEVNVLWVAHVVHHQSEDYNLAVALRQDILTSFTSVPFFLPMALVGVPPIVLASMNSLSLLYQFWIHTELVGRLGWFEAWFNTPSHHRVHHGINPQYLDKNYGAILIVWDRLFGTFEREDEAPVYGVVKPLHSFNPLWAQVEPLLALASASAAARRPLDKLRVWFAAPGWRPEGVAPYPGVEDGSYVRRPKYDPPPPPGVAAYALVQFAVLVPATAGLMFVQETAPAPVLAAGAALVLLTLATTSGLLEGRPWARPVEALRLVSIAGAIVWARVV